MELTGRTFHLQGKVQHYVWGGYQYLPKLLGINNLSQVPFAEYWMGAHPSAPSQITNVQHTMGLDALIQHQPEAALNPNVYQQFGGLPYLFKILDVRDMLSIQVHPTKLEAAKGFAAEEAAGIPLNAPHRNYKDTNHKPEIMVALSEFWLLHGFKPKDELVQTLLDVKEFNILLPLFKTSGYKGLYQMVMELEQPYVDNLLAPLVKREIRRKAHHELTKNQPGWWVAKLFEGNDKITTIDRGIFSIYFFNIVQVASGEAVYQGAGIPHAYLEGQNVELMANSDNVLRGGLTSKHVDVPELLKHTLFEGIVPNVMKGQPINHHSIHYPCPIADFGIQKIEIPMGETYTATANSLEIVIATEGAAAIVSSINTTLQQGGALAFLPEENYAIKAIEHCVLFKAYVP